MIFPHKTTCSGELTTIHTTCVLCSSKKDIVVNTIDYQKLNHLLIQDAFPEMSIEERERMISDLCDKCFPDDT